MAKPPDGAGPIEHPISGYGYELRDSRGQRWAHIWMSKQGYVTIGYPKGAYDSVNVVTLTIEKNTILYTQVRSIDAGGYSTVGTDDEERVALADMAGTRRIIEVSVPADGPTWALIERKAAFHRLLQPSGELRAELDAQASGIEVKAFNVQGKPLERQRYLMP